MSRTSSAQSATPLRSGSVNELRAGYKQVLASSSLLLSSLELSDTQVYEP